MKGLVFFILLVGAQLIASFPKELSIKDTEIKSQNSRQKRQDRPGLIDFSGTPPERPGLELPGFTIPPVELEDPEAALPKELFELLYPKPEGTEKPKPELPYPSGQIYQAMSKGQQKGGLDLDFGADLNLPEDVVKNADIDIGLRLNAMDFEGGEHGRGHPPHAYDNGPHDHTDCDCIRDLVREAEDLSDSLSSILSCLEDLAVNASASSLVRNSPSLTIEDASGNDLDSSLSSLDELLSHTCSYNGQNCKCCYSFVCVTSDDCFKGKRDTHEHGEGVYDHDHGLCVAGELVSVTASLSEQADEVCRTSIVASEEYLNNLIEQVNDKADGIDELRNTLDEDTYCRQS